MIRKKMAKMPKSQKAKKAYVALALLATSLAAAPLKEATPPLR